MIRGVHASIHNRYQGDLLRHLREMGEWAFSMARSRERGETPEKIEELQ